MYRIITLLGLLILLGLGGCSSFYIPFVSEKTTDLSSINIVSTAQSNRNVPVAIDLVFIYKTTLKPMFIPFGAREWYENKAALMLRHDEFIDVAHFEVVPFSNMEEVTLPEDCGDAIQVLLFANFIATDGQYAADITTFDELQITLSENGYQLEELDP